MPRRSNTKDRKLPRYPIYIPTKGRHADCKTARFLVQDGVPFRLVVEPQERDLYAEQFGLDNVLVLPFQDLGQGSIPSRNWIKEHATKEGHERHWQLDDNISKLWRRNHGVRLPCASGVAIAVVEDFVDRYENIAVAGMNYCMFVPNHQGHRAFEHNVHVYSCTLVLNSIPFQWRGRYNEDTDLCLQVLAGGWCTVLFNAFLAEKMATMTMKGGNSDELYRGDGRLKMARALERMWPGVVEVKRRFRRPQHVVNWRKFDTPLKLKTEFEGVVSEPDERGMKLVQVKPELKSKRLKKMMKDYNAEAPKAARRGPKKG